METLKIFVVGLERVDMLIPWDLKAVIGNSAHIRTSGITSHSRYAWLSYHCVAQPFGKGKSGNRSFKIKRLLLRYGREVLGDALSYMENYLIVPSLPGTIAREKKSE